MVFVVQDMSVDFVEPAFKILFGTTLQVSRRFDRSLVNAPNIPR
jgi:hypothetical protein